MINKCRSEFAYLALALALTLFVQITPAYAVPATVTMLLTQTPSATESLVTLHGRVKPARAGVAVSVQIHLNGKWKETRFKTYTAKVGTWNVTALATGLNASVKYRARAKIGGKNIYSPPRSVTIKEYAQIGEETPNVLIDQLGPGGRIHGADISLWQHPQGQSIDFVKMYAAGLRFVMIKSSDTKDASDAIALKYLLMDRLAAQAAGIFTGFYHYAILPDVTDPAAVVIDAQAQAQKVIWRLAAIGGYTEKDLPYALDLENNCVRLSATNSCAKYAKKALITLWAKTFLKALKDATNRTPILYSYPTFLESAMTRDVELTQYPLWIAQYGIDPADPLAQPGQKVSGCFVHSWTAANCSSQWTMWQYTSCGIAPKYGVPGRRLDLNIFRGSASAFLDLAKGSWVPDAAELMPANEPSQLSIRSTSATTTSKGATVLVDVTRPDGRPVVTGTVAFVIDSSTAISTELVQRAVRQTSGTWSLSIKGAPAGTWRGLITFIDASRTHASSSQPIEFTLTQSIPPSPTSTAAPIPKPAPTKKPASDGCANQIRN